MQAPDNKKYAPGFLYDLLRLIKLSACYDKFINTRIGDVIYNLVHHQGVAVWVGIAGFYSNHPEIIFAVLVLFGHSAMDRIMGYGLKYPDHFKHTHLGWIGKEKE